VREFWSPCKARLCRHEAPGRHAELRHAELIVLSDIALVASTGSPPPVTDMSYRADSRSAKRLLL